MAGAPARDLDLDLDLDAFEGPFDLLLTLVLKEELDLAEVEIADIVVTAKNAAHFRRQGSELEAFGEFLVLIAALLELKARGLFPDEEIGLEELDPEAAAEELAERLAAYRRIKAAAGWLSDRLEAEADRFFRTGPAPIAPAATRPLPKQEPAALAAALRALAAEPPEPSLAHLALAFPPVSVFLERFRATLRQRGRFVFDREVAALPAVEQGVAFLALLELRKGGEVRLAQTAPFDPISVWSAVSA